MLLDYLLAFSTDQVLRTTADSENFPLDLEVVAPNLGKNAEVGVLFIVKEPLVTGVSVKLDVYHGSSTTADELLCSSRPLLTEELVKGFVYFLPIPREVKRFIGLTYTISGTYDAGNAVDAYLGIKM